MKVFGILTIIICGTVWAIDDLKLANENPTVLINLFSNFRREHDRVHASPNESRMRLTNYYLQVLQKIEPCNYRHDIDKHK